MEKIKMQATDLTQHHISRIQALFPHCVTEGKDAQGNTKLLIDFNQLQQELSSAIIEHETERYQLNWPGKRQALIAANTPINKTLRPCRQESVNFDTTKNLFIEGDNLDALKLLQESYQGKVKMIYIDPPYNTGNDFIYKDNYAQSSAQFLEASQQKDEDGNQLVSNPESNGRFHSDWLSMMYPRLKIAKELLRDDGAIFISIGDEEVANLRAICDELFGQRNFEGHIHWRRRNNQPNDPTKMIGLVAEHILVYARDKFKLKENEVGKIELSGNFSNPDNDPRGDWASKPWKSASNQSGSRYTIFTPTGLQLNDEWMGEETTYKKLIEANKIIFPNNGNGSPRKKYFKFEREAEGQCATNWWSHDQFGHNQEGSSILTDLMDGIKNTFSNPKPPRLIRNLIAIANCKAGDIILDFFLGSASTFQAAFEYNQAIQIIGIQIPEPLCKTKKDHKPAIEFITKNKLNPTIAEISKERIRRAGSKTLSNKTKEVDIGFRVLKIDSSNMEDVYYTPHELSQADLENLGSHIKPDRQPEDLLFQVMITRGLDLSLTITERNIAGKHVFFVGDHQLAACFDHCGGIDKEFAHQLAKENPQCVVFRDEGFQDSAAKINTEQIFQHVSAQTKLMVL